MRISEHIPSEELGTHDPGLSVFDIGRYSVVVRDRTVDYVFVGLVLTAVLLAGYLVLAVGSLLLGNLLEVLLDTTGVLEVMGSLAAIQTGQRVEDIDEAGHTERSGSALHTIEVELG